MNTEKLPKPDVGADPRVLDSPKAVHFLHFAYEMFPSDDTPVQTDVVTYGRAARIYPEKQDAKAIRTWQNGADLWTSWTNR